MDCKKCKSAEIRPSQRNFAERAFGYVIPLRPYRCEECDLRQWGVMRPIFERSRFITWGALTLLIALFVLNAVLVIPVEPEPYSAQTLGATNGAATAPPTDANQAATGTADQPTTTPPAETPAGAQGEQANSAATPAEPAGNQNPAKQTEVATQKPATPNQAPAEDVNAKAKATDDAVTATTPSSDPQEPAAVAADPAEEPEDVVSAFVRQRQAQNLAKQKGTTPPPTSAEQPKAAAKTQPKASPRQASAAKPKNTKTLAKTTAAKATATKPAAPGTTSPVKFSHHLNGDVLTIDVVSAGPMSEAKIKEFLLDQKKLIIDFPGKFSLVPETMAVDHRHIRQVRTGLHRDYMRLVLDLTDRKNPQPEITLTQAGATIRIGQ